MEINYEELNKKIIDASNFMAKKDYKNAEKAFLEYVEKADPLYKVQGKNCYSFKNLTEFYLFVNCFKLNNGAYWTNLKSDVAYMNLGYIKIEQKDYERAKTYLEKSLKFNPINLDTYFEMVEIYKMKNDLDEMIKTLHLFYPYIYDPMYLARYYRNLGYAYIEKENYSLAFSLYLISLEYNFNNLALSEMTYIRKKLNDDSYLVTKEEAIKNLKDNNINIGIDKKCLNALISLSKNKELVKKDKNFIKNLNAQIEKLTKKIGG